MNIQPEPRIGDAEREAAVSALGEHYAAGRLTREEYDERSEAAWAAKTNSDLWPLFTDLPAPARAQRSSAAPRREAGHGWRGGQRRRLPLLPVLLIALASVIVLLEVPWLLFLLGGLWLSGFLRGGCSTRGRAAHASGSDRAERGRCA
jgi:Domain of unknown function (DUF1707)